MTARRQHSLSLCLCVLPAIWLETSPLGSLGSDPSARRHKQWVKNRNTELTFWVRNRETWCETFLNEGGQGFFSVYVLSIIAQMGLWWIAQQTRTQPRCSGNICLSCGNRNPSCVGQVWANKVQMKVRVIVTWRRIQNLPSTFDPSSIPLQSGGQYYPGFDL